MLQMVELGRGNFTGRILGSPWRRIPNVSAFKLKISGLNELLFDIGVNKKLRTKKTSTRLDQSDKANRYVKFQVIRLRSLKGNPSRYWRLAWFLMEKSRTMRAMAVRHTFPSWWYRISVYQLVK